MVAQSDRCPGHAAVRSRQSQERTGTVNLEDSQAASSHQERASAAVIAETWQIGVHDPGTPLLLRSEAAEWLNVSESTVVPSAGRVPSPRSGLAGAPHRRRAPGCRRQTRAPASQRCTGKRCRHEEHPACLAGRSQEVKHDMHQLKNLRTWLRDEEARCPVEHIEGTCRRDTVSDDETPSTKSQVQRSFPSEALGSPARRAVRQLQVR